MSEQKWEIESAIPTETPKATFREMATDAIRYWEPRRLLYNAALSLIVIGYFIAGLPASKKALSFDAVLFLIVLAVLANLCYCAAYIADIFAQFSGFRILWLRWRWLLLTLGTVLASIITRFFALGFFASKP